MVCSVENAEPTVGFDAVSCRSVESATYISVYGKVLVTVGVLLTCLNWETHFPHDDGQRSFSSAALM